MKVFMSSDNMNWELSAAVSSSVSLYLGSYPENMPCTSLYLLFLCTWLRIACSDSS